MSNRRDDDHRDERKSSSNRDQYDERRRSVSSRNDEYYDGRRRSTPSRNTEDYDERRRSTSSKSSNNYDEYRKTSNSARTGSSKKSRKAKRKKKTVIILIIEIVVLLVLLFAFYMVFVKWNVTKVGKVDLNEDEIINNMNTGVADNKEMKGYRNIALFGVDSREGDLDKNTRSDTIIIASINQDTGDVKLCSVYRDTFLNLGNDTYTKCNAAYAKGGPQQAINMLNMNLDMDITDFITIGFGGMTDVINELGGVTIDVDDSEISHLNNYQSTMAQELKMEYKPVTKTGKQLLNGLQATAYCRIRYTKGDDFMRAQRQREVMKAIMDVAQKADASTLSSIANKVFDETYTSLDINEIIQLLGGIANYKIVADDGFPQEQMRATGTIGKNGSCVIPEDLSKNVVWLHEFLFEDNAYTATADVQSYSNVIQQKTSPYLK
ncbi:MAG: LCP family protein [Butyrivibrio sp.]|nr:LCP family protein [Butyrivibrio sp.]